MPKKRGNGEGSVVRYKDGYRAVIVVGWRDKTHPIKHTKSGFATIREAREYISSFHKDELVKPCSYTIAEAYAGKYIRVVATDKSNNDFESNVTSFA